MGRQRTAMFSKAIKSCVKAITWAADMSPENVMERYMPPLSMPAAVLLAHKAVRQHFCPPKTSSLKGRVKPQGPGCTLSMGASSEFLQQLTEEEIWLQDTSYMLL